jgi:hypothetical protein
MVPNRTLSAEIGVSILEHSRSRSHVGGAYFNPLCSHPVKRIRGENTRGWNI